MNHTWLYQESPVDVDIKHPTMLECLPGGKHSLYVQIALNRMSWLPLALPTSVTISNLPWPIKAIVIPNDGQTPIWRGHRQHQLPNVPESEILCPFIYPDRTRKMPMTRSLTIVLASGDTGGFVVTDVYPGERIPPLPWQVRDVNDGSSLQDSIDFWIDHSFPYDSHIVTSKREYSAPSWTKCEQTISL